jgi:hypothetical protein
MSDPTRARISTAFEEELRSAPVPPGLRALSVRAAASAPRRSGGRPALLALVAVVVGVALIATLVVGSRVLRSTVPVPTKPAPSAAPPSPRSGAAMVYDSAHGELVLFGGTDAKSALVNETWTWDGKVWRQYHLSVSPSPRHQAAMAYDQARNDVVLFGGSGQPAGRGGETQLDDTWTWNGSSWKERHPAHVPPIDFDWRPSMAYDPGSKTVLMYAFEKTTSGNQSSMVAETWSWNGSDWTRLAPVTGPTLPGTMVAGASELYLIADAAARAGGHYVRQMWRWAGTTWSLVGDFAQPLAGEMAFDSERNVLVSFEGGDTWTWDGSTWTRQHTRNQPASAGYMAYFPPLHEVVMWGELYTNWSNAMWAWDGADWRQVAAGTMPAMPAPAGQFGPVAPAAAATFIRQTVTTASPVLLPAWLPAGMDARGDATADFFTIDYKSDQRDRIIALAIMVANPPPGDDRSTDTRVRFRHALALKYGAPGYAEYFVYDVSAPRSDRWIQWIEPGFSSNGMLGGGPGVPYFLFASGLTDAEFWQVANSLR